MPVPDNAQQIYQYLTGQGYSGTAAAGILGNIEQESTGNPESVGTGGAGLIGWTPPSAAFPDQPIVTGSPKNDLSAQLTDLWAWNQRNAAGPSFLNKATSPANAALLYMNQAERPAVATENLANRQASAIAVANAAKTGNWKAGTPSPTGTTTSITSDIGSSLIDSLLTSLGIPSLPDMFKRLGLILFGGILVIVGIMVLIGKQGVMNIALTAVPEARAGEAVAGSAGKAAAKRAATRVVASGVPESAS